MIANKPDTLNKSNGFVIFLLPILTSTIPFLAMAQIMTVNGPIASEEMGLTLIHEHIMVDWIGADSTGYHRWDRNEIVARALPYLNELKDYGLTTFLDCTPAYLGRDPYVLQQLSDSTGIHMLTNTGYYGSGNNKFLPKHAMKASANELAALWINEYNNGIDGSGIKPGFIKISVENQDTLSQTHENLIRAAALTHLETGLTIVSHTGSNGPAMAQLEVLNDMGVSPSAFVWTHAQNGTMDGYLQAASLGAWISLDNIKDQPSDDPNKSGTISWFIKTLLEFKNNGILDHLLISHDAGWYDVGEKNGGGYRDYTDLFAKLIPRLRENGFAQKDIDLIVKENPRNAYTIRIRKE